MFSYAGVVFLALIAGHSVGALFMGVWVRDGGGEGRAYLVIESSTFGWGSVGAFA